MTATAPPEADGAAATATAVAYECPYAWCIEDHTHRHDDFDGLGSRFHNGPVVEFRTPNDSETWPPFVFGLHVSRFDDAEDGTSETRLCPGFGEDGGLTPAQAREFASWVLAQADAAEKLSV